MAKLERENLGIPPATNFNQAGVWRCPITEWCEPLLLGFSNNTPGDFPSSYGYNDDKFTGNGTLDYTNKFGLQGHYVPDFGFPMPAALAEASFRPVAESEVTVPSDMMAIGDDFSGTFLLLRRPIDTFKEYGNILTRHRGNANVVFCDGHVESPTLKFLLEDDSDAALRRWNRDNQPRRK